MEIESGIATHNLVRSWHGCQPLVRDTFLDEECVLERLLKQHTVCCIPYLAQHLIGCITQNLWRHEHKVGGKGPSTDKRR